MANHSKRTITEKTRKRLVIWRRTKDLWHLFVQTIMPERNWSRNRPKPSAIPFCNIRLVKLLLWHERDHFTNEPTNWAFGFAMNRLISFICQNTAIANVVCNDPGFSGSISKKTLKNGKKDKKSKLQNNPMQTPRLHFFKIRIIWLCNQSKKVMKALKMMILCIKTRLKHNFYYKFANVRKKNQGILEKLYYF